MDTQQSAGPAAFIDVLRMMKQCSQKITSWSMAHLLYKAAVFFVCLSVCTPPPFPTRPSDRNQIWHTYSGRYGTHSEIKKKFTHPTPEGSHGGVGGFLGGQKIKRPGNVMNCPENPQKVKTRWGVGWKF